jgi:hypothetical protein
MKHQVTSFLLITIVVFGTLGALFFVRQQQMLLVPQDQQDLLKEETIQPALNKEKHSVPLEEIVSGGPPKDGIPSIDDPKFITIDAAKSFLNDKEPGISISMNGINRFYPYQILVWHEIVNDKVNDERILITYCPLCGSGIVFDPIVDGERVEFGTSGKLWQSNLVMYDRKTESYWSQVLGKAIVGDATDTELDILPYDISTFGDWRKAFPKGDVLSKDTGALRFYGRDPYGDYYTSDDLFFDVNNKDDDRLDPKEFVLGIVVNNKAKAYLPSSVKKKGTVVDTFEGITITAKYNKKLDAVQLYKANQGRQERINPFSTFWFAWAAVHPETELYK